MNDVEPALDDDYNGWHANEHAERLTVPGILWARRYAVMPLTPGQRYLTLYGLQSTQVLESAPYRHLLADPTPMSAKMRPHLHNVSRWMCDIRAIRGGLDGSVLLLRVSEAETKAKRGLGDFALEGNGGCLLAQRIPDAEPLPWMKELQAGGVSGN